MQFATNTTVLVRDIPPQTTDLAFATYFNTAVSAVLKRKDNLCRGFGFLVVPTKEEAELLIAHINSGIQTPFGVLRAELSNGGKNKKNNQKKKKKKKQHDDSINLRDLGRFRSRRSKSKRLHPNSTTVSSHTNHVQKFRQNGKDSKGHLTIKD